MKNKIDKEALNRILDAGKSSQNTAIINMSLAVFFGVTALISAHDSGYTGVTVAHTVMTVLCAGLAFKNMSVAKDKRKKTNK